MFALKSRNPSGDAIRRRSLAIVLLLLSAATSIARAESGGDERVGSRPHAGGDPESITVRLGLLDIGNIDDREQRFTIDAYVEVGWQDPRLATADNADPSTSLRSVALNEIWTPSLLIVNNRGLDRLLPDVATVDTQGNVLLRQRLSGPLAVDLQLRKFPFDTQHLTIDIASYQYSPSEIAFSGDTRIVANVEKFRAEGWSFEIREPAFSVFRLEEDGRGTPMLTFGIIAERNVTFYVLTLALPMTLILALAWLVHWLPAGSVPPRLGMASASVFSLIAFGITFRLSLPRIDYLTQADRFVVYSTVLVAVSLAIAVITARYVGHQREAEAERLAHRTRIGFPLAYALIVILILAT